MTNKTTQQLDGEISICPLYAQEKNRTQWIELQNKYYLVDPKCGHAISYLIRNTGSTLRPSSAIGYATQLRRFIEFLHSQEVTVCSAELSHVFEFFKMLSEEGKRENTLKVHKGLITNLFKHVELYTNHEPNLRWDSIREFINVSQFQTLPTIERKPLTKTEISLLFKHLGSFRNRLIVRLALETGLRNFDIRALKRDDIDIDGKLLKFYNHKSNIWQTMPISGELALHFRHWLQVGRESTLADPENEYLFPGRTNGHFCDGYLSKIVVDAAEAAGIQEVVGKVKLTDRQKIAFRTNREYHDIHKVTMHTLRHTFNQLLIDAGVPREYRSAALGHKSPDTTKKYYEHNDEDYEEVIAKLFPGLQLGI